MLTVGNLTLKIKDKILLSNINFKVKDNGYFAVIGPNGAGKTLLMESIIGFIKTKGDIYLNEINLKNIPIENKNIGFVYQDFSLFPNMNVYENIAFPLKIKKEKDIKNKVEWIAEKLAIMHLLNRKDISKLSGGEKQKVAIARALITKPNLLILDEPFSAIDSVSKKKMYNFIKYVHKEFGLTILHTTHSFEEAIYLADTIAILDKGIIKQIGNAKEILKNPSSEFVAHFVGLDNIIPIVEQDQKYFLANIPIPLSVDVKNKKFAILHSEEIILSTKPIKSSARFCVSGKVKEIITNDFYSSVKIDVGFELTAKITNYSLSSISIKEGKHLFVIFKEGGLKFI